MKFIALLIVFLIGFSMYPQYASCQAKPKDTDKKLVLILIDGFRWQELFRGAEFDLLNDPQSNSSDSILRMKKYWAEKPEDRRKKLLPFVWSTISSEGQLYGNRDLGNEVNVKNPYWISYPGRAEVLSGFVDEKISSNSYGNNTNPNILEFLNRKEKYKNKVVTFACWGATGRCLYKVNSTMLINVPWENITGKNLTASEQLANEIQHLAPKTFGMEERLDFEVYALAKSYIMAKHPKVVYLDFGDTDEYAHAGEYDKYLEDAHNLDKMIENLWKLMQRDPFYKGKTTFMIFPDHGRGVGRQWTDHGTSALHSDETWLMLLGPDVKPLGEMKNGKRIFQTQFAGTIANLLGYRYTVSGKEVGNFIEGITK